MVDDTIFKALSLSMSLSTLLEDDFYDFFYLQNEKIMSYSVSLVSEIDQLLEDGLSKEESKDIILNCKVTEKDSNLTEEEGEYLQKYSLKLLNIRDNLYQEEQKKKTVIVKKKKKDPNHQKRNI